MTVKEYEKEIDEIDEQRAEFLRVDKLISNLSREACIFLLHCNGIQTYDYEETWELREAISSCFAEMDFTAEQIENVETDMLS